MSATELHVHIVRFAPAKLNLTLAVTGRRADGYHELHSVMVPLSLGDALTVRVAGASATCDSLRVSGLPVTAEPDNLVLRAIAGARDCVGEERTAEEGRPAHLAVRLSKRIPVAAGLGGGSSDAAAAIDAALAAWGASLPAGALDALAASLGSDVPFFRAGRGAVVTGRGESVEPLPIIDEPPAVLLVTPGLPVSTAAVFRAYAAGHRPRGDAALRISEELAAELRRNPSPACLMERAADLARANDLGPAAVATAPWLADLTTALGHLLERPIGQSGSGPSLWVLYPTLEDAHHAARAVRRATASGDVPSVGDGEPLVTATTISTGSHRDPAIPEGPSRPRGRRAPHGSQ